MANNRDLYIKGQATGGGLTITDKLFISLINIVTNGVPYYINNVDYLTRIYNTDLYRINGTHYLNGGTYNRVLFAGQNSSNHGSWGYANSSSDFLTITSANAGTTSYRYNAVAANPTGSLVSLVGEGSAMSPRYSTDGGTTWSTASSLGTIYLKDNVWFPAASLFIAVGYTSGPVAQRMMISPTGETWTTRSSGLGGTQITCVAANSSTAVAGCNTPSSGNTIISYSTNGTSWTGVTTIANTTLNYVFDIVWVDSLSLFVAIGTNNSSHTRVITSSDGITWSAATGLPNLNLSAQTIIFNSNDNYLYIFGTSGVTYRSSNATSWSVNTTKVVLGNNIPYKNSSFVDLT